MATTLEQSAILGKAFEQVIKKHYGSRIAPEALITQTGIKPLDALLGGGIVSSGPIILSSTPETGKSTIAYQLSKVFQETYDNSVVLYLDIEGSGNSTNSTQFRISRIDGFELDQDRFRYEPILLNVMELFDLIQKIIEVKRAVENKTNKEFYVMIVWDSIPSTPSSKTESSTDVNQIIGLKARQISYCLDKYNPMLKFNRITFVCIDQVRANLQIEMFAAKEQSVGNFKDMKSASNIFALQHATQQWLFFSKNAAISESEGLYDKNGDIISGWYMNVLMEKNKLTSSKDMITVVFSKRSGIDKFWSEFTFLSQPTPVEKKVYKNKLSSIPLAIVKSGHRLKLEVVDTTTGEIKYSSDPIFKRKFREVYEQNDEFHKWFDYAVDISCQQRIIKLRQSDEFVNYNKDTDIEIQTSEPETIPESVTIPEPEPVPEPVEIKKDIQSDSDKDPETAINEMTELANAFDNDNSAEETKPKADIF